MRGDARWVSFQPPAEGQYSTDDDTTGIPWRDVAWTLSLGFAAALIGVLVFFRATP